jgi:hypothetical protein
MYNIIFDYPWPTKVYNVVLSMDESKNIKILIFIKLTVKRYVFD